MVVGPALIVLAFVIVPALLMTRSAGSLHWGIFASAGVVNWSTLLGGPIGEEPGWRGYALPRLQSARSVSGLIASGMFMGGLAPAAVPAAKMDERSYLGIYADSSGLDTSDDLWRESFRNERDRRSAHARHL